MATVVGITACSDDNTTPTSTSSTTKIEAGLDISLGTVTVASAGAPIELPVTDQDAILNAVGTYVEFATITPLFGATAGSTTKRLSTIVAPSAAASVTGPEADSLSDGAIGKAPKDIQATLAPTNLTGLADITGAIDLIGATFDLTVTATNERGDLTIHRTGELMFTRDGEDWKLLSFRLAVTREGAGLERTASSTSGSTAP